MRSTREMISLLAFVACATTGQLFSDVEFGENLQPTEIDNLIIAKELLDDMLFDDAAVEGIGFEDGDRACACTKPKKDGEEYTVEDCTLEDCNRGCACTKPKKDKAAIEVCTPEDCMFEDCNRACACTKPKKDKAASEEYTVEDCTLENCNRGCACTKPKKDGEEYTVEDCTLEDCNRGCACTKPKKDKAASEEYTVEDCTLENCNRGCACTKPKKDKAASEAYTNVSLTKDIIEEPVFYTPDASDIIGSDETGPVISLMDARPNAFCRTNYFSVNSVGDPEGTHINQWNTDLGQIIKLKLEKDEAGQAVWDNLRVLEQKIYIYPENIVIADKYQGCRTSYVGRVLESLLGLTKYYKGIPLVDEYKLYPLWNVTLKDEAELVQFVDYLQSNLQKAEGKAHFDEKPVLMLTLLNDPSGKNTSADVTAKVEILFDRVNYNDMNTTQFFNRTQKEFDKMIMAAANSKPFHIEGLREHLLRTSENFFSDFKPSDLALPLVAGLFATTSAWWTRQMYDRAYNKHKKHIPSWVFGGLPEAKKG